MAVNMNRRDNKHLCVILFLMLLCIFRKATSQVSTAETSLSISTVTTTSTQAPTTTTTLATTTTISPQQQPTAFDPNSLIGQCPCDLTGNSCDVNCCCDEDCTENDKLAFSKCLPFSFDVDDRLCFRKGIFQFVNTTPVNSDPFCIYYDNYKERNYYTNPSKVDTLTTFQEYQNQFSGFSFMSSSLSSFDFSSTFYKNGDQIFTVFESQVISVLGLPRSLTSSDCVDKNPAAYLTDQSFSCVRRLSAPSTDCTSLPALNAKNYANGFKVVMSPQMFQVFNVSVDGAATSNLYNNSYTNSNTGGLSTVY
ncbi:tectonic-3-like [Pomacea canaliculata]|uniref:tectonic-3-like n=1 Tax=Pomacea canaliculata TaxID=400727 RepID=UPI000D73C435|nr:tectonic-3-like [Pomacea canaliculata]